MMGAEIAATAGVTGTPAQCEAAEVTHARYRTPPVEDLRPLLRVSRSVMRPDFFSSLTLLTLRLIRIVNYVSAFDKENKKI